MGAEVGVAVAGEAGVEMPRVSKPWKVTPFTGNWLALPLKGAQEPKQLPSVETSVAAAIGWGVSQVMVAAGDRWGRAARNTPPSVAG